jgi:hypothetical protein
MSSRANPVTASENFAVTVKAAVTTPLGPVNVTVGAVVSKLAVTLVEFDVAVTAVPAFPTVSAKAILKVTGPDVSLASTV